MEIKSAIKFFFSWWIGQILSIAPPIFPEKNATTRDAVLITPAGPLDDPASAVLSVAIRQGGRTRHAGQFSMDAPGLRRMATMLATVGPSLSRQIALPAGSLLEKSLVLPAVTEAALEQVLSNLMDVETPFSADEVYWTWTLDERDRAEGEISVTLLLLPRTLPADLLEALGQNGIRPAGLLAPRDDGTMARLPLRHAEHETARPLWVRRRFAWSLCLASLLVALALPFLLQYRASRELAAQIAALRPDAAAAQALRARLDGSAGGGAVISLERCRLAAPLRVLAALTEALPDDTFLNDLLLKDNKLRVAGLSSSAPRLIEILSTHALFRNPAFAAPVTKAASDSGLLDAFSLTADVRSGPCT